MALTSITKFKIPKYANTDLECPVVNTHSIYTKDCSALSTDFVGAASLTESSGFFFAELVDKVTPKLYEFCLKVTTTADNFITVLNLEFVYCHPSTITSTVAMIL